MTGKIKKKFKRNLPRIVVSLLMVLCHYSSFGQSAASYSFSSISGSYSYLSGGSTISAIQTDDALSGNIPIGFSFNFCGNIYTQLKASSNGWITFNTSVTSSVAGNSSGNLSSIKPALMPLWDDIDGSTTYGGSASYSTSGTSPNRVFTIEYKNWQWNYSKTEKVISFQVKLYEGSNMIEFVYKPESGSIASGSATIGICDGASSHTYLSLNNTSASPTASSTSFTTSINAKPAEGQVYRFNPPPCTGTPTAGTASASASTICLGENVLISLPAASTGASIRYQWQFSTDNVTFTDITDANTGSLNLSPKTAGYYRCLVKCYSTGFTATSSSVNVSFTNNITSGTPAVRCGTGTVSLSATGTSGSTINWFTDSSGGLPIGTGSPFTTPTIATTTHFYVAAQSNSSGTKTLSSGTSSSVSTSGQTPFGQVYESAHTQYLILASDLLAAGFGAGEFNALSFNITTKSSTKDYSGFTLKMANTSATSLSGFLSPAFTTVYGPSTYTSVSGTNSFIFSTAFVWDGISNVVLDACFDNYTSGLSWTDNDAVEFVAKGYTATYGMYNDGVGLCGTSTGGTTASLSGLPKMTINGNLVCSSPRVKVTATVNTPPVFSISGTQTVCNNTTAPISVSSALSNYDTYRWSPATDLYTDAACTIPYTAGTSASNIYAKTSTAGNRDYICTANNTSTLCSAQDTVSITVLPASIAVVASPTYLCGSGHANLKLNPASEYGDAQFQWQSSSNNTTFSDSAGATSGSLNTNMLTANRYYRVAVKNSSGTFCLNSTSDTVIVRNPNITSTTGANRCGPGSVTLKATGNDGALQWFASVSGADVLDTGTNFITPELSGSTTYYVQVKATPNDTITVGTGTGTVGTPTGGTGQTPFSQYYESARSQYLITAADLTASGLTPGNLIAMNFNVKTKNSEEAYEGYTIKMAHTTAVSLSGGFVSPSFTTVYGPADYTVSEGTNLLPFATTFNWDGTSNIVVQVCFSNAAGAGYTNNDEVFCTSKSYVATYATYEDGEFLCSDPSLYYTTSSTNLPNMKLIKSGCISPRLAVTAVINPVPTAKTTPSGEAIQICYGNTTTIKAEGGISYKWLNSTGLMSGETRDSLVTGDDNIFKVITSNTFGCTDTSDAIEVNVNPSPTVIIEPAGSYAICDDSTQLLTGTASTTGLTYQWFNAGIPIPDATKDSLYTPDAGYYTLQVYLGSCSDTSNEVRLRVNPLPDASFTKTGTTDAICLGSTLELTALPVPSSSHYQWMRDGIEIAGATGRIYNAATGGIYTVRITDSNNCKNISDSLPVINTPMGKPKLSPTDSRFCEGTDIMLYANAGPFAKKYTWMHNGSSLADTTPSIIASVSGFFEVTVMDIYGCYASSSKVTVTVDPLPVKPSINKIGMVLMTANPYTTYQWYRNGKIIPGATFRSYTMSFDGKYHVAVTNSFGCFNVSDTLSIQGLSVSELPSEELNIQVYPNPAQDKIYIKAPQSVNLIIQDIQGKQVSRIDHVTEVDMNTYADGVYIFNITNDEGVLLKKDKVVKRSN